MRYRFGPYEADRVSYRVTRGNQTVELTPKLLDLLFYLVERPATLVTKEALLDGVWPGANVTDNALAQAMSDLRDVLGDDPSAPVYIRTVARRGYRFVAPVEIAGNVAAAADARDARPPRPAPGPTAAPGAARSIAVIDFTNVTGEADVAWLSAGIAETVTSDLTALDHFRVIDRWRVVQTTRLGATTVPELQQALGVSLLVTGSFQRRGTNLRITARVIDVDQGAAVADVKVDGQLEDAFSLQDAIVTAFAREMGVPKAAARGVRETSSLDAFRAYTEGSLKIESLDTDVVSASIRDFERAIQLDPSYAGAYTGLANAQFVAYEMTRSMRAPNLAALRSGIEHARRAIALDGELAEAHATLSFLLVSALEFDEARGAAQKAVALEPENWRHQYRLGHASWGSARLRAMERALSLYPQFQYATYESAMVHVARGQLDAAERMARAGIGEQDRQAAPGNRFPSIGFHWLLGAFEAQGKRYDSAIDQFERELAQVDGRRLYGCDYGANALVSRGHAELAMGRKDAALVSFRDALAHVPGFPRALVGEAAALAAIRDASAGDAHARVEEAVTNLLRTERPHEAAFIQACAAAMRGNVDDAARHLDEFLDQVAASHLGWTIPLEPCFRAMLKHAAFAKVLARLAERAA